MPCPWFEPSEPLLWSHWRGAVKPPLGRPFAGACRSACAAGEANEPDLELCNLGYAAGRCARFPGGADSLQLAARIAPEGGLTVLYALEQAHLPVASGSVRIAPDGGVDLPPAAAPYEGLIRAYASSCRPATV